MSKIKAVRERIQAAQSARAEKPLARPFPAGKVAARQAAAGIAAEIAADVESLHGLTLEEKTRRKRDLVERYRAHAEAFLAGPGGGVQDPVVPWWVIWLWDIGEIAGFIRCCRQAEAHGQKSPIRTPLREFRWHRVIEWAAGEVKAGRSPEPYFSDVSREAGEMPGSIAWEYHALAGKRAMARGEEAEADGDHQAARNEYEQAVAAFEAAEAAHDKARVKTALQAARKALERLADEHPVPQAGTESRAGDMAAE